MRKFDRTARTTTFALIVASALSGCTLPTTGEPEPAFEPHPRAAATACLGDVESYHGSAVETDIRYRVLDLWASSSYGPRDDGPVWDQTDDDGGGGPLAIEGADVRACASGDIRCENPLANAHSDADGNARLSLRVGEDGWRGYVEVDAGERYFRGLYLSEPAGMPDATTRQVLVAYPKLLAPIYAQAVGDTFEAGTATLRALIYGCDGEPLELAELMLSVEAAVAYEEANVPYFDREHTGEEGTAWAFGVEPGEHDLTVRLSNGRLVAQLQGVPFRADTVTTLRVGPTP